MKDLIIQALDGAIIKFDKQIPLTKKETKYINITNIKPLDIGNFIKENNLPDDVYFGGKPNGYDSFDEVCLCYEVFVPTTEKEKLKFKQKNFSTIAFKFVYDTLTNNGYKRVGFNTGLLKEFDNTTVYDMYINKEFDRLVKYYSLPFVKNVN